MGAHFSGQKSKTSLGTPRLSQYWVPAGPNKSSVEHVHFSWIEPRRPRGATVAGRCAAAADGTADETQVALPQQHPDHRRRLRHPRHCARQRRAAGAQDALSARRPCQRRGKGRRGAGRLEGGGVTCHLRAHALSMSLSPSAGPVRTTVRAADTPTHSVFLPPSGLAASAPNHGY